MQVEARISAPVQTAPGAHTASYTMGSESPSWRQSGRCVALTTHPPLAPRLKKEYRYTSNTSGPSWPVLRTTAAATTTTTTTERRSVGCNPGAEPELWYATKNRAVSDGVQSWKCSAQYNGSGKRILVSHMVPFIPIRRKQSRKVEIMILKLVITKKTGNVL